MSCCLETLTDKIISVCSCARAVIKKRPQDAENIRLALEQLSDNALHPNLKTHNEFRAVPAGKRKFIRVADASFRLRSGQAETSLPR